MSHKFLNTKKFHPRRLDNIRKVAAAEAKYNQEKTAIAELLREREEEKNLEALRNLQIQSGRIQPCKKRVEFIYKAPLINKKGSGTEEEEEIDKKEEINEKTKPDKEMFKVKVSYQDELTSGKLIGALFAEKSSNIDHDCIARMDPLTLYFQQRSQQEELENKYSETNHKDKRAKPHTEKHRRKRDDFLSRYKHKKQE